MKEFLDRVEKASLGEPKIYVDCGGDRMSKFGVLSKYCEIGVVARGIMAGNMLLGLLMREIDGYEEYRDINLVHFDDVEFVEEFPLEGPIVRTIYDSDPNYDVAYEIHISRNPATMKLYDIDYFRQKI